MAKAKKYYVVWIGRKTGVFDDWNVVKGLVEGYSGAKFLSYTDKEYAYEQYEAGYCQSMAMPDTPPAVAPLGKAIKPIHECLTVDAAYSSSTKLMEYRCVWNVSGEVVFASRPLSGGSANIGEFLALVGAMKFRDANKMRDTEIYTDSATALAWLRNCKVNTTMDLSKSDPKVLERIRSAERYLLHDHCNVQRIHKWQTGSWGEIPADYGRK